MNELIKVGQKRTELISVAIILVSFFSIYFYSFGNNGIEPVRVIKQLVRFIITVVLLVMIHKGKNWAKVIALILFSLAILGIVMALSAKPMQLTTMIPFLIMIFVYLIAIYHFGFSKSFKTFFKHQNSS